MFHCMWSIRLCLNVASLFMLLVCGFSQAYACEELEKPDALLQGLSIEMIESINANIETIKNDSSEAKKLIEKILLPHADFRASSKLVLSNNAWSNLSEKERNEFTQAFGTFLVRTASVLLASFLADQEDNLDNDVIKFDAPFIKKDDGRVVVKSRVHHGGPTTYLVNYKLWCNVSSWKIYDVEIDGVSVIRQFHGQFKNMINKDGFDKLMVFIKTKNKSMLAMGTNATRISDLN